MTDVETLIARLLCGIAALIIVVITEPKIDSMTDKARPGFRIAFVLLTVGGFWQIIILLAGKVPPWSAVIVYLGLALLLIEERYCPRSCARGSSKRHVPLTRHDRGHLDGASVSPNLRRSD